MEERRRRGEGEEKGRRKEEEGRSKREKRRSFWKKGMETIRHEESADA